VEIDQRLPDLSDKELENLQANAVRLAESGTPKQRQQAESLLPLLATTIEARRSARLEADRERRRASGRKAGAAKVAKDPAA